MRHERSGTALGRRIAGILAIVAAVIATIASGVSAQNPPRTSLDVAVIGVSASTWPAIVAREKGFFAEEGLDVNFSSAGASARVLQQVVAGAANIGSSSLVDTF